MKISQYTTLAELTKSQAAERAGIDNTPGKEELGNLETVCQKVFDPVRSRFGCPIAISSGYRCKELNKLIGGSKTSQHPEGRALDIDADVFGGITNAEIFAYIRDHIRFDQLIWEFGTDANPAWVHVSYVEGKNRGEVLKAKRGEKGTVYTLYGKEEVSDTEKQEIAVP